MLDIISSDDEAALRRSWALARLGEVVNEGRESGWVLGEGLVPADDSARIKDAIAATEHETPMRVLQERLGLSVVELDVLWLLAVIELEPVLARAAQALVHDGMHVLNVQVLERLVDPDGHGVSDQVWSKLSRLELVELQAGRSLPRYRRAVRCNDRVIDLARGGLGLDVSLAGLASLAAPTTETGYRAPAGLAHLAHRDDRILVTCVGLEGSGRATAVRAAASRARKGVLRIHAPSLAADPEERARQLRTIAREARLHRAVPLFADLDATGDNAPSIARDLVEAHQSPVFATMREPWPHTGGIRLITFRFEPPDLDERIEIWRQLLPTADPAVLDQVSSRYVVTPGLIAEVAKSVSGAGDAVQVEHIHVSLRDRLEQQLTGLARRVETKQTWDDLVLPVDQFDLLVELVGRVRHRHRVLHDWGFGAKMARGLGLSVLLSGPPGTGKTMIAGLIARELGRDLYQVDLSRIVSKYIGETEKQLSALFDAAESGHAILLFDEADSLFAKRTEVKSSNDRYANLEVNYLLQRVESFSGIAILTTNHESALDPAFQRRLALHVRVPMPELSERQMLWRAMIPAEAARSDDLDLDMIARNFVMSGGYIRNAVLRGAYFAAEEQAPISQRHLIRAARAECEAMGRVLWS